MILLGIDGTTMILAYFVGAGIAWAIFYYTVKAAVKNGMIEAKQFNNLPRDIQLKSSNLTPRQQELQLKYEKGEIGLDEYKKEWEALK